MPESKLEKELLKSGDNIIVGTACVGIGNYVGPMVACSIILDYDHLHPLFNNLISNTLPVKYLADILKALKYYATKITTLEELNSLANEESAIYYTNYYAVNKLIWKMLKKREVPTVFITEKYPLKEVVNSSYDSLHSANKRISDYMIWDNSPTLNMLVPKADYIVSNSKKPALCTKIAKALANIVLSQELAKIEKQIPQYHILEKNNKEQENFVKKMGNTQYHRLYIESLAKYPINTLVFEEI